MKLSLKKIVLLCSSVLALVAFFMLFADPLKDVGFQYIYFGKKYMGVVSFDPNWITLIGFVLVLVAAVLLCLVGLGKDSGKGRLFVIVSAALLAVGALLMFLCGVFFKMINSGDATPDLGIGSILGGVLALLAAGGACVSEFVLKE